MAEPIIMLGVGATKSGTSWLHATLAAHPQCYFRSMKELHYFDAIENGKVDREIAARRDEAQAIRERIALGRAKAGADLRLKDREDLIALFERGDNPDAYVEYLTTGHEGRAVVGEVTPAYSLVSEERLRAMSRLARDVRFVYLMRDPVARLWSHVRMIAGRRSEDGRVAADRAGRILKRVFRGEEPQIVIRGDYRTALTKFATAIDPTRLLVLVFEDLVSGQALNRLWSFLGISAGTPARRPVHVGTPLAMTDEQIRAARVWLAPQYDFVADWLGARPKAWAYDIAEAR